MKVLYLVSGIGPPAGWGTEFIQNLIIDLAGKGVEATIINPIYIHTHPDWRNWIKEQNEKFNIRVIPLESPSWIKKNLMLHFMLTPLIVTISTIKLLRKEKFDLVHEFSSTPIILIRALILKLFFRTPTIFTLSVYNNTLLGNFKWFKIFDFAKYYLIPSKEIINQLKKIGIAEKKLIFSPPGINLTLFKTTDEQSSPMDKTWARKQLKLPENKFIISYFGSLTFEKGVDEIIEASKKLDQSISKNLLILVSSIWKGSNEHKILIKKIKAVNLDYLELRDKYIDIPLLLSASDAIILPQRTGFGTTIPPIALLEAIASKRRVVATDTIGVRELLRDTENILIPPFDSISLSKAITKIYSEKETVAPIQLSNIYDIKNSTELHLNLYKTIN